jgi:hypothetical protein
VRGRQKDRVELSISFSGDFLEIIRITQARLRCTEAEAVAECVRLMGLIQRAEARGGKLMLREADDTVQVYHLAKAEERTEP